MTSGTAIATAAAHPMAWTNERLKLSCADGIGFKSLWRMLVLDKSSNGGNSRSSSSSGASSMPVSSPASSADSARTSNDNSLYQLSNATIAELLENRQTISKENMSLLKCLAINALELSAPATGPMLLLQPAVPAPEAPAAKTPTSHPACGAWLQLAGHPESIAPAANGTVRKRISGPADSEAIAYRGLCVDPHAVHLIPQFHGCHTRPATADQPAHTYLELQNLLHGFHNPAVMDIKMGRRTFLESEVTNDTLRPDLYRKMAAVDGAAPTDVEHSQAAITKLRYMLFREQMSSSQHHGFRVEALKQRHQRPVTDLKTMKCGLQVDETIERFVAGQADVTGELIVRLRTMRSLIERSAFFGAHEVVGSSVFIVYDAHRVGAWLIDFAKCRRLPEGVRVDHRRGWVRGNHEEGLLHGFDELIGVFERVLARQLAEGATAPAEALLRCAPDCRNVAEWLRVRLHSDGRDDDDVEREDVDDERPIVRRRTADNDA